MTSFFSYQSAEQWCSDATVYHDCVLKESIGNLSKGDSVECIAINTHLGLCKIYNDDELIYKFKLEELN